MKRLTAFLLVLALLSCGTSLGAGMELPARFDDVPADHWAYDVVRDVWNRGLMQGVEGGGFAPDATASRAMVVTILYRMAGSPDVPDSTFPDARWGWYSKPASWAARNGIVLGYDTGYFGPNDPLTREQMATVFNRYCAYLGIYETVDLNLDDLFVDSADVSPSALIGMAWACQYGILNGKGGRRLAPGDSTTRAELAAVLSRFAGYLEKKTAGNS